MSLDSLVVNGHFKKQQITGVQRYALELIREFEELDADFTTVEPPAGIFSDSLRQLWMQAIMPRKIPKNSLLWSPTNIGPVFYKNQVVTLHDIADQLHPEWFSPKYVSWRSLILPRLLKNVKGIITVSEYSRQTILEKYPWASGKIKVIYNGVHTGHFYPRPENEISEIRHRYELKKPYVITVGSLDRRKNTNGLIKAWNMLPASIRKELDLVIAGGTAEKFRFELKEEIGSTIRFLGYVEYGLLPALYSAAQFFIYPSLFEGFGLPVLEAMACKTPVITSNTTSLDELAADHALTIDPADSDQICKAIQQFFNSEEMRTKHVDKACNYAQSFTWRKSAERTLQFLKEEKNGN